jgi:hypothetical protein
MVPLAMKRWLVVVVKPPQYQHSDPCNLRPYPYARIQEAINDALMTEKDWRFGCASPYTIHAKT